MSKKFIPSRDRRPEALEMLWKGCLRGLEDRMSNYTHTAELISGFLDERRTTSAAMYLKFNFSDLMQVAVCNFKKAPPKIHSHCAKHFNCFIWRRSFGCSSTKKKIWVIRTEMICTLVCSTYMA